ncbi:GNAT family N-acetyltransferase [Mycobacterium sp. smrl_JER01]
MTSLPLTALPSDPNLSLDALILDAFWTGDE